MGTNDVNGQFFENYLIRNERWLVGTSERNGEHQTDGVISEDEIAAFFCKNNLDDELHYGEGLAGEDFDTWYAANEEAISAYYEAQDEYELEYGTDEAKEFMLEAMESFLNSVENNPDLDIDITNLIDSRTMGTRNLITRGLADTLGVSATTSLDTYKTLASNVDFINDNFQYESFDTTGLTRNEIKREEKWARNKTESVEYKDNNGNVLKKDYISYSRGHVEKSEIFDTNGNLLRTEHYDNKGNLTYVESLDENGNTVRYSVNKDGNIEGITVKDSNGEVLETVSADFENGVLVSTSKTTDGNKETTAYKDGKATQTTYSGSFSATITYDSDGEPKEARRKTTVDGNTVYEQLNSQGKPTGKYFNADGSVYVPQAQQPAGTTPTGGTSPTGGTPATGTPPAGGTQNTTPAGETQNTTPAGGTPAGEGNTPSNPDNTTTERFYNAGGYREVIKDAEGRIISQRYWNDSQGTWIGDQTTYTYNADGSTNSQTIRNSSTGKKTERIYDSGGYRETVTDSSGNIISERYWSDSQGTWVN